MVEHIIYLSGTFISCLIICIILFQFIEERSHRVYDSKLLYLSIKIIIIAYLEFINIINHPILNIASWIILFNIINLKLYTNPYKKNIQRIIEISVLILVLSLCETVGFVAIDFITWRFGIDNIHPIMLDSINITFSKVFVILFYYIVISKLWRPYSNVKYTLTQYFVQIIIIIYSVANLAVIVLVISKITSEMERILLVINMSCIVFSDFYLLYFTRFVEENNQLRLKLSLFEQQSLLQYEYYTEQEEKYNESIKILHDVNKHLKVLEDMYQLKEDEIAITYAQEIGKMLMSLALTEYTSNPILNVLLNDKKKYAKYHNIDFNIEVGNVDLHFMEPIEITTLFGNLLDNAIEACNFVIKNKYIDMKLDTYNDFIAINISNSTIPIEKWNLGKPVSRKGKHHGIGLMNVDNIVNKYNGSMVLEEINRKFSCNIILNNNG